MSGENARLFWFDERITRVGWALLVALIAGCLFKYSSDTDASSALKRGDFPGIYSPAVIIAEGKADRFYDIALHGEIQHRIWPSFGTEMYISVYPPYYGALLTPLAHLNPETARNSWTLLSLSLFLFALYLLRGRSSPVKDHPVFMIASLLLFMPFFFGVLGGQNSAFSILFFVGALLLLEQKRSDAEFFAGILFGLWLFKPQFGLIAGAYLLFARRWFGLAGFALVGAVYWCIGVKVLGPDWFVSWFLATSKFAGINYELNSHQMASLSGFLYSVFPARVFPGMFVLGLSALLGVVSLFWIARRGDRAAWALGPILVLLSPQTLFYDLSIAIVACLPFLKFRTDRDVNCYIVAAIIAGVLFELRNYVSIALPFFLALASLAFIVQASKIDRSYS